ncbi:MAG: methyltransferase domain-containing protein [Chryseolinea sp.]
MKNEEFYIHDETVHNKSAARIILPLLFSTAIPHSVLDVGCGLGTWLSVCEELGIADYFGVDGDYVDKQKLTIPIQKFAAVELRKEFDRARKFDLVICLEVAEHLPESSSDILVRNLIRHGDRLLFSAAIPGQGGQYHLNEQWPEYWERRFNQHGYYFHDTIRPLIWANEEIEWWYRQNIFVVSKEAPTRIPYNSLSVVHPKFQELTRRNREQYYQSLIHGKQGLRLAFRILLSSIRYAMGRLAFKLLRK